MKSSPVAPSAPVRQSAARWSAALVGGPADLLDFLIPLWAGAVLGLNATVIGMLVATELFVSFAARFPAGLLADMWERRIIVATGAVLYGLSCAGYALSTGPAMAFFSAVLGGLGGALFWVALQAIVSESAGSDSFAFPKLMTWQETGSWVAFVAGLTLIGSLNFQGVFLAASGACFVSAVMIATAPRRPAASSKRTESDFPTQRLRPMLLATALTSLAEAAIGLLLLLHLQGAFDLDVVSIALVFLPGAIVMSLIPGPAHRITMRIGRHRVAAIAALSSATFAFTLAFAPSPLPIAALWILSAAAWAAIIPIEQSVIAEVARERGGKGFGLYESAKLAGAGVGALVAGVSYETTSWQVACILFASVIAAGAIVTPWAVRRSGAANVPRDEPSPVTAPAVSTSEEMNTPGPQAWQPEHNQEEKMMATTKADNSKLTGLGWHLLIFAIAQIALAFTGMSWIVDSFSTNDFGEHLASGGRPELEGIPSFLYGAGKIWVIFFVIDVIWTLISSRKGSQTPNKQE
ncbi:MAG TPA: MFS transporter [Glutamicibacter sp.]|uniref:MFS transporter n=1 Tax=Glutamicibacter arilaitensis TaxID=256701 RepID=UPI000EDA7A62|nr:MFS transporter [Glutamicibacter sp.]